MASDLERLRDWNRFADRMLSTKGLTSDEWRLALLTARLTIGENTKTVDEETLRAKFECRP